MTTLTGCDPDHVEQVQTGFNLLGPLRAADFERWCEDSRLVQILIGGLSVCNFPGTQSEWENVPGGRDAGFVVDRWFFDLPDGSRYEGEVTLVLKEWAGKHTLVGDSATGLDRKDLEHHLKQNSTGDEDLYFEVRLRFFVNRHDDGQRSEILGISLSKEQLRAANIDARIIKSRENFEDPTGVIIAVARAILAHGDPDYPQKSLPDYEDDSDLTPVLTLYGIDKSSAGFAETGTPLKWSLPDDPESFGDIPWHVSYALDNYTLGLNIPFNPEEPKFAHDYFVVTRAIAEKVLEEWLAPDDPDVKKKPAGLFLAWHMELDHRLGLRSVMRHI